MHTRPSPQSIPRRLRQTDRRNRVSGVAWATSGVHSERDRVDVGPHSPGFATFVAGRCRGEFWNRSRAHPHARSRAESASPRARVLHIAGGDFSPATVLREHAQTKYSRRFRTAYGPHRPTAEARHRTFRTKSAVPPTDRRLDAELPATVASVAGTINAPSRTHRPSPSHREFRFGKSQADSRIQNFLNSPRKRNGYWLATGRLRNAEPGNIFWTYLTAIPLQH